MKNLVTVSVAVILFAAAMSTEIRAMNAETLVATATCAAVLVVCRYDLAELSDDIFQQEQLVRLRLGPLERRSRTRQFCIGYRLMHCGTLRALYGATNGHVPT